MTLRVEVGQRWRYVGEAGQFFTIGKEYTVTRRTSDLTGGGADWFQIEDDRSGNHNWQDDGDFHRQFDLVCDPDFAEVPDNDTARPVRTRTITEIVSGTYGGIMVSEPGDYAVFIRMHIEDHGKFMDAAQLRAAARVFVSLAEALEWNEDRK